ncbi:MAG: NIPSNAP family protein [Dehalococcoidia bacterium]
MIKEGEKINICEMRMYDCKPGSMPDIMKRWGDRIAKREEHSPCLACGHIELGKLEGLTPTDFSPVK